MILNQKVMVVCKGSHDPILRRAKDSWAVSSPDGQTRAHGSCPYDDDSDSFNSYRAGLEVMRSLLH